MIIYKWIIIKIYKYFYNITKSKKLAPQVNNLILIKPILNRILSNYHNKIKISKNQLNKLLLNNNI